MDFKARADRARPRHPQAGRKSAAQEDGKRREEEIFRVKWEEDGPDEEDDFQTDRITRFSGRR